MQTWQKIVLLFLSLLLVVGFILLYMNGRTTPAQTQSQTNTGVTSTNTNTTPTETEDPEQKVKNFYTWYLQGLKKDIHFTTSQEFTSSAAQWLTPQFRTTVVTNTTHTYFDQLLLAQDYYPSWISQMQTKVVSSDANSTTITLTLGSGSESYILYVSTKLLSGKWYIDSVSKP